MKSICDDVKIMIFSWCGQLLVFCVMMVGGATGCAEGAELGLFFKMTL